MKAYPREDIEKLQVQGLIREWRRSGLLDAAESARLESELRVDVRRTNSALRAVLYVFTLLIVAASVGFVALALGINDTSSVALLCFIASVLCVLTANFLIESFRLYRFGVEEALAFASVVLVSIAVFATLDQLNVRNTAATFITAAAAAFGVYAWFGYLDLAVTGLVCAAVSPLTTNSSPELQRLLAATVFCLAFIVTRPLRRRFGDDFPGGDYGILQAVSWFGVYIALNLQIDWRSFNHGLLYWLTYATTFALPVVGLRLALREKDRYLVHANLAMALLTLGTNKPYLGLERRAWDPILFGLLLMGTAILIKRWLAGGPNEQRAGFTAKRLLAADNRALNIAAAVPAVFPGVIPHPAAPAAESKPEFGSGRSGGAGASGSF